MDTVAELSICFHRSRFQQILYWAVLDQIWDSTTLLAIDIRGPNVCTELDHKDLKQHCSDSIINNKKKNKKRYKIKNLIHLKHDEFLDFTYYIWIDWRFKCYMNFFLKKIINFWQKNNVLLYFTFLRVRNWLRVRKMFYCLSYKT